MWERPQSGHKILWKLRRKIMNTVRKVLLISAALIILLNVVTGIIITLYPLFSCSLVTINILVSTILVYFLFGNSVDTRYRISFSFSILILFGTNTVLTFSAPPFLQNNLFIILILASTLVQVFLVVIAKMMNKFVN